MSVSLDVALAGIELKIRSRLIEAYSSLRGALSEGRLDVAGIAAGKLCEAVIRHCQQRVFGSHTPFGKAIPNFADECRRIVGAPAASTANESERVIVPRALIFLYTMRNKRGIGHVGGDVDPNVVDTSAIGAVADWVICELIRVHHGMSLEEAQDLVDALGARKLPEVWEVGGEKRILRDGLQVRDQVLMLLYSTTDSVVLTEDLVAWTEYSNPRVFRSNVLSRLHAERLVEWDRESESVMLSPKGVKAVEAQMLLWRAASDASASSGSSTRRRPARRRPSPAKSSR